MFNKNTLSDNRQTKPDQSIFYGLLCLLIWAPLPMGSNYQWAWSLLAMFTYLLAFCYLALWLKNKIIIPQVSKQAQLAILMLIAVQLWVAFQLLPLPNNLAQYISPRGTALYQHTNNIMQPLSIDRHASYNALMKGSTYALAFILTLLLVNTRQRFNTFCYVIIFSGVFQAVYGSIMVLSGLEYSFIIKKWISQGSAAGTFVNRNHYAGYLNICLAIGIGLLASQLNVSQNKKWRAHARDWITVLLGKKTRLRIYLAIMVIGLIMSHSRMGNSAFFFSLSIIGLLFIIKEKQLTKKALVLFISLLLIDALIVGNWFGFKEVAERLEKTVIDEEGRLEFNKITLPIIKDYLITGSGAESMASLLPAYSQEQTDILVGNAHNDYIEFLANLGLLGCLLLAGFIITTLYAALSFKVFIREPNKLSTNKRRKKTTKQNNYAVIMILLYIAIHSTVDFNLSIPAFSYTLLCCLALAFVKIRDPKRSKPQVSEKLENNDISNRYH